jgi:hypothetical protein
MEATESPETAMKYYDELLEADSANGVGFTLLALVNKLIRLHA